MKISTIIPAYNAAAWIGRAIDSLLAQTRPVDEIIVVNDGSRDNTSEVVAGYKNIKLIEQANAGVSAARNTGIKAASGQWISFLDADDQWLPDKLQSQCEYLRHHSHLSWVASNYYRCDCTMDHTQTQKLSHTQQSAIRISTGPSGIFDSYFSAFLLRAAGHTDTMLIKKDAVIKAGLFYTDLPEMEDDDLWLRLAYQGLQFGFILEPLAIYHVGVDNSLTKVHKDSVGIDAFIQRHLELSAKAGYQDEFKQCAVGMLSSRLHLLMGCRKGSDVRRLTQKYTQLLAPSFRKSCYIGSFCPPLWNFKEKIKNQIRRAK